MAASSDSGSLWWDRELDSTGKPIRVDVRASAHQLWDQARARVQAVLGDSSDAASLMEESVLQVSRYLDRKALTLSAADVTSLLMCAFCRALRRYARKLSRIELVADLSAITGPRSGTGCTSKEDCRLDAQKARRLLNGRGRTMFELRTVGFEWKEIAEIFQMTDCAVRAEFSREVKRAKLKAARQPCDDEDH